MPSQVSSLAAGITSGNMSQIQSALFTNQTNAKAELDSYLSIFNPATYTAPSASIRPAVLPSKPIARAYVPAAVSQPHVSSTAKKPVQVYS